MIITIMHIEEKKLRSFPIGDSLQPPYASAFPWYPVRNIFNRYPSLTRRSHVSPLYKVWDILALHYFDFLFMYVGDAESKILEIEGNIYIWCWLDRASLI